MILRTNQFIKESSLLFQRNVRLGNICNKKACHNVAMGNSVV